MKIILLIYCTIIEIISSSIIPISFEFIDGEMTIQIQQSKNIIPCRIVTSIPKNFIPENFNLNSKTKRKYDYKDPSIGFFDQLEGKKSQVMLYDDWFFINDIEFIMKYYVDPKIKKCIISFSKEQSEDESLINKLYINKKINANGFGIKFDDKNETKGMIYLGGLPEEEKKGLYSFSYKYSFFNNHNIWSLPMEDASIKIKENTFSIELYCEGHIELEREDILLVPPIFYEFLYDKIFGFYIKEKSCDFENNNLVCDCKELKNINSFKSIYLNVAGLRMEFNIRDSFIKKNDKCYFIFKKHENNFFIFGKNLLKKYKIEFLNNKQINLYSKNKLTVKKNISLKKVIITIKELVLKYPIISFIFTIILIACFSGSFANSSKVKYIEES